MQRLTTQQLSHHILQGKRNADPDATKHEQNRPHPEEIVFLQREPQVTLHFLLGHKDSNYQPAESMPNLCDGKNNLVASPPRIQLVCRWGLCYRLDKPACHCSSPATDSGSVSGHVYRSQIGDDSTGTSWLVFPVAREGMQKYMFDAYECDSVAKTNIFQKLFYECGT